MLKTKSHFNRQEKAILKVIYSTRRFMTIREVAKKSDMSWVTARKYLKKLVKRGFAKEK